MTLIWKVTQWHSTESDLCLHTQRSSPGHKEMFPHTKGTPATTNHHQGDITSPQTTSSQGTMGTGRASPHWHRCVSICTSSPSSHGCRKRVQAALLETEDGYSQDNRQLGLTYRGVVSVSIKIAGRSYIAHLWSCQGDSKPLPSWPCSAGLCRPGFSAAHLHQQCRLMRRKHWGGLSHAPAERPRSVI